LPPALLAGTFAVRHAKKGSSEYVSRVVAVDGDFDEGVGGVIADEIADIFGLVEEQRAEFVVGLFFEDVEAGAVPVREAGSHVQVAEHFPAKGAVRPIVHVTEIECEGGMRIIPVDRVQMGNLGEVAVVHALELGIHLERARVIEQRTVVLGVVPHELMAFVLVRFRVFLTPFVTHPEPVAPEIIRNGRRSGFGKHCHYYGGGRERDWLSSYHAV